MNAFVKNCKIASQKFLLRIKTPIDRFPNTILPNVDTNLSLLHHGVDIISIVKYKKVL